MLAETLAGRGRRPSRTSSGSCTARRWSRTRSSSARARARRCSRPPGFRDAVEIGREKRYELYDLQVELPRPLVPRHLRFDVPERMLADGTVAAAARRGARRAARPRARGGRRRGGRGLVPALLHERRRTSARRARRWRAPRRGLRVSLSSEVVPGDPRVRAHLDDARERLRPGARRALPAPTWSSGCERLGFGGRFFVMLSGGGIATVETAVALPGAAARVGPGRGRARRGGVRREAAGVDDLLSFDMGGTTAKLCVIEGGQPLIAERVRGRPRLPASRRARACR